MPEPIKPPFVLPKNRSEVTREPDPQGRWTKQFPEMLGFKNQGGGKVPADFDWPSSPKQWQEELTENELRQGLKVD
jgi:hypothetical protein